MSTCMYYKCKSAEQIRYVDVTSLYPYICKTGTFPVGHPTIITEGFDMKKLQNQQYHGLIRCTVLPPRRLFHPVLPSRFNDKLIFALCRTCADQMCSDCYHSDAQRAIKGDWVTLELYKAMELGYKVIFYKYEVMKMYIWINYVPIFRFRALTKFGTMTISRRTTLRARPADCLRATSTLSFVSSNRPTVGHAIA